jgi:hypothetical protein
MRISEHDFENQDVVLDFHEFDNCRFTNCKMFIHGYGAFSLISCHFDQCKFLFAGAAVTTLAVLTKMYHGGFRELVEPALENIRQNKFPEGQ